MQIAKETEIPASTIMREDAGVSAQKVIEAAEEVQEMVSVEAGNLLKMSAEDQRVEALGTKEQASGAATEDPKGKDHIHNASDNIADLELSSLSSSTHTSSTASPSNLNSSLVTSSVASTSSSSCKMYVDSFNFLTEVLFFFLAINLP